MAKLSSKDLELKVKDVEGEIKNARERYTNMVLEGKSDRAIMGELSALETELQSTRAAVEIAKGREAEEAERLRFEAREKAKKEAKQMRDQALGQLGEVIDQFLLTLDTLQAFNKTVERGNELLRLNEIPGKCVDESEYMGVTLNILMGAAAIQDAWPRRSYAGIDDLHKRIAKRIPQRYGH